MLTEARRGQMYTLVHLQLLIEPQVISHTVFCMQTVSRLSGEIVDRADQLKRKRRTAIAVVK